MRTDWIQPSTMIGSLGNFGADGAAMDLPVTELFGRFHGYVNFREKYSTIGDVPDDVPWILYYTARFTPNMTDDHIRDVIETVGCRAAGAVRQMGKPDNLAVVFVAIYPSWAHDTRQLWLIPEAGILARRLESVGWGRLWAMPSTVGVKTVRDLIADQRFTPECRQLLSREAAITRFIAFEKEPFDLLLPYTYTSCLSSGLDFSDLPSWDM